jgi:hypothetical protein
LQHDRSANGTPRRSKETNHEGTNRRSSARSGRSVVGRLDRHRAVEIDGQLRDSPGLFELAKQIEEILGASDGEGRDQEPAPLIGRAPHRLLDDGRGVAGRVKAIAVGGFDQQSVGGRDPDRIAHDRHVVPPEIAGVHEPASAGDDLDGRGAENVAGHPETGLDAGRRFVALGHREEVALAELTGAKAALLNRTTLFPGVV